MTEAEGPRGGGPPEARGGQTRMVFRVSPLGSAQRLPEPSLPQTKVADGGGSHAPSSSDDGASQGKKKEKKKTFELSSQEPPRGGESKC